MKKVLVFLVAMLVAGNVYAASFTLTIPDELVNDLIAAYCDKFGYEAELWDDETEQMISNPETAVAFTKRMLRQQIKDVYLEYKVDGDIETARDTAITQCDTDTTDLNVD